MPIRKSRPHDGLGYGMDAENGKQGQGQCWEGALWTLLVLIPSRKPTFCRNAIAILDLGSRVTVGMVYNRGRQSPAQFERKKIMQ